MAVNKMDIVEATFDALQADGLPSLSYDRIAAAAGLSRQLVRYHYPDLDQLMVDVCDYLAGVYRDVLIGNAKNLEGPMRIDMFLDFYFGTIQGQTKPSDDRAYDALVSLATKSPNVRRALRNQYCLLGQVLSHEFQLAYPALQRRGADELSYVFVSLMYGHWKMVASLGLSDAHNQISRAAMSRTIRSFVEDPTPVAQDVPVWSEKA